MLYREYTIYMVMASFETVVNDGHVPVCVRVITYTVYDMIFVYMKWYFCIYISALLDDGYWYLAVFHKNWWWIHTNHTHIYIYIHIYTESRWIEKPTHAYTVEPCYPMTFCGRVYYSDVEERRHGSHIWSGWQRAECQYGQLGECCKIG